MMKTYRMLSREYEELNQRYQEEFAKRAELEYQLSNLQEEAEHMRRQDAEVKALHQNVRQLKHDMKNHFMVIASYLNEENHSQAKEYISEILDKLNAMHSYVETGNSLLNHILNEKLAHARMQGISVKAEIESLSFERMKSIDFASLFANMLDNAIEASMIDDMKGKSPELQVSIQAVRGYDTICVKNRIASSVLTSNPQLESTKAEKEKHGFGVGKIKAIVDEYQGMIDFYEEEKFFCVKVFIPQ